MIKSTTAEQCGAWKETFSDWPNVQSVVVCKHTHQSGDLHGDTMMR